MDFNSDGTSIDGLREVEDCELKLDAEEELQVEEVDRLFREPSTCT